MVRFGVASAGALIADSGLVVWETWMALPILHEETHFRQKSFPGGQDTASSG